MSTLSSFDEGFLLGILAGEGHFGGDGKQPQVTLRMHVRHERLFAWILEKLPDTKLYGPYQHGGRNYYQWMARGDALRKSLLPILLSHLSMLDDHVRQRIEDMIRDYRLSG
ncbi:MAG: hypothetical protein JW990_00475 [Thermoleophilia bacterium]|nr:hypothetical protein [Thermoleophilia bacterium]